uniref:Uncharacterized protein n=1 Tax=Arundo donax TaxID=35708 RepID=A0A0A9C218_ARUDO
MACPQTMADQETTVRRSIASNTALAASTHPHLTYMSMAVLQTCTLRQ